MPHNEINIKDINLGGLADSKRQGVDGSVYQIHNMDIHTEPGIVQLSKKMENQLSGILHQDENFTASVADTAGKAWFFNDDGKVIWRSSSGTYANQVTDISPSVGSAGVLAAKEFDGYIYYSMERRIGRFEVTTDNSGYVNKSDDWGTPSNASGSEFNRQMAEVNDTLFIASGNTIDQVADGVLTTSVKTFPDNWVIKDLAAYGTDLMIGLERSGNPVDARIVRWNTWSTDNSFTSDDYIEEDGFNCWLPFDNFLLASVGIRGNLYIYNNRQLELFRKIPDDGTFGADCYIYPKAWSWFRGQMHFGVSKRGTAGIRQSVYSIGAHSKNFPMVLSSPFSISSGNTNNIEITTMCRLDNTLMVGWKDSTQSPSRGIDEIQSTYYSEGYYITRVIDVARRDHKKFNIEIYYDGNINDGDIEIEYQKNGDGSYVAVGDVRTDSDRNRVYGVVETEDCNTIQIKVILNGSGSTPKIQFLKTYFE